MPRNPNKQRCTYPGCRAWALRGQTLCAAHAGRTRRAREAMSMPTLEEEIRFLVERRTMVDDLLQKRVSEASCSAAEALRYLTVLAQVGKSLAGMLVQRAALGGADELERFFEAVAERVRELQPGEQND